MSTQSGDENSAGQSEDQDEQSRRNWPGSSEQTQQGETCFTPTFFRQKYQTSVLLRVILLLLLLLIGDANSAGQSDDEDEQSRPNWPGSSEQTQQGECLSHWPSCSAVDNQSKKQRLGVTTSEHSTAAQRPSGESLDPNLPAAAKPNGLVTSDQNRVESGSASNRPTSTDQDFKATKRKTKTKTMKRKTKTKATKRKTKTKATKRKTKTKATQDQDSSSIATKQRMKVALDFVLFLFQAPSSREEHWMDQAQSLLPMLIRERFAEGGTQDLRAE